MKSLALLLLLCVCVWTGEAAGKAQRKSHIMLKQKVLRKCGPDAASLVEIYAAKQVPSQEKWFEDTAYQQAMCYHGVSRKHHLRRYQFAKARAEEAAATLSTKQTAFNDKQSQFFLYRAARLVKEGEMAAAQKSLDTAKADLDTATREHARMTTDDNDLFRRVESARAQAEYWKKESDDRKGKSDAAGQLELAARTASEEVRGRADTARAAAQTRSGKLVSLQATLKAAQDELTRTQREHGLARDTEDRIYEQLRKARADLEAARQNNQKAYETYLAAQQDLRQANDDFVNAKKDYEQHNNDLQADTAAQKEKYNTYLAAKNAYDQATADVEKEQAVTHEKYALLDRKAKEKDQAASKVEILKNQVDDTGRNRDSLSTLATQTEARHRAAKEVRLQKEHEFAAAQSALDKAKGELSNYQAYIAEQDRADQALFAQEKQALDAFHSAAEANGRAAADMQEGTSSLEKARNDVTLLEQQWAQAQEAARNRQAQLAKLQSEVDRLSPPVDAAKKALSDADRVMKDAEVASAAAQSERDEALKETGYWVKERDDNLNLQQFHDKKYAELTSADGKSQFFQNETGLTMLRNYTLQAYRAVTDTPVGLYYDVTFTRVGTSATVTPSNNASVSMIAMPLAGRTLEHYVLTLSPGFQASANGEGTVALQLNGFTNLDRTVTDLSTYFLCNDKGAVFGLRNDNSAMFRRSCSWILHEALLSKDVCATCKSFETTDDSEQYLFFNSAKGSMSIKKPYDRSDWAPASFNLVPVPSPAGV